MPSASTLAAETRGERCMVVSGLIEHQAPLGNNNGCGPAQLHTETLRNIGNGGMGQMHIGDVEVKVVGYEAMDDRVDELLVEGFDYDANKCPARRHHTNSRVCH
jgi:hypothetical protein